MNVHDYFPKYVTPPFDVRGVKDSESVESQMVTNAEFSRISLDVGLTGTGSSKGYEAESIRSEGVIKPQVHQKLASRFLSFYTPYTSQLIFHGMGTGKTALAVLVAEMNMAKHPRRFKNAVIITKSDSFVNMFVDNIIAVTGDKYSPTPSEIREYNYGINRYNVGINISTRKSPEEWKELRTKFNIHKKYRFHTMGALHNQLVSHDNRPELYSNSIVIVDEAHNLYTAKKRRDVESTYESYFKYLHGLRNNGCKIVLMSGTPIRDHWSEIADLVNLIVPEDRTLPRGQDFNERFHNDGKRIRNIDEFVRTIRGYVSFYTHQQLSDVPKKFIGQTFPDKGVEFINLDVAEMSEFQSRRYIEALRSDVVENEDDVKRGVYTNSIQASLFVFPDGSWGSLGQQMYMIQKEYTQREDIFDQAFRRVRSRSPRQISRTAFPALRDSFKSELERGLPRRGTDAYIEGFLRNISKFSAKYAKCLADIHNNRGKGTSFVYCELLNGGGLFLFARLLEMMGYSQTTAHTDAGAANEQKRYAMITSETSRRDVSRYLEILNNENNATGNRLQVVLGSSASSEGLSMKHVTHIGILAPHWNYSQIDQAIARGVRYRSHEDIKKLLGDIEIRIHHYTALPVLPNVPNVPDVLDGSIVSDTSGTYSIDFMMYKRSEDKDKVIKLGERVLKSASVDCITHYKHNTQGDRTPYTRDCDYAECEYKCVGIDFDPEDYDPYKRIPTDMTTYNLHGYPVYDAYSDIQSIVSKMFETRSAFSLDEVYETVLEESGDNPVLSLIDINGLCDVLGTMVSNNTMFRNMFGIPTYFQEQNNTFFLASQVTGSTVRSVYYSENPVPVSRLSFHDILHRLSRQNAVLFMRPIKKTLDFFSSNVQVSDKSRKELYARFLETLDKLDAKRQNGVVHSIMYMLDDRIDTKLLDTVRYDSDEALKNVPEGKYSLYLAFIDMFRSNVFMSDDGKSYYVKYPDTFTTARPRGQIADIRIHPRADSEIEKYRNEVQARLVNFNYYGIVDTTKLAKGEKGFKIRDVARAKAAMEEKTQRGKLDGRKRNRGEECGTGTLKVSKLATIAFELKMEPVDHVSSSDSKESRDEIIEKLKKASGFPYTDEDLDRLSIEDIRTIYRFTKYKSSELCELLRKHFVNTLAISYYDYDPTKKIVTRKR